MSADNYIILAFAVAVIGLSIWDYKLGKKRPYSDFMDLD